jgi:hypothetical protein
MATIGRRRRGPHRARRSSPSIHVRPSAPSRCPSLGRPPTRDLQHTSRSGGRPCRTMLRDSEASVRQLGRAVELRPQLRPPSFPMHAPNTSTQRHRRKAPIRRLRAGRGRANPSWSSPSALSERAIADAVVGTARCAEVGVVREGSFGAERNVAFGNRRLKRRIVRRVGAGGGRGVVERAKGPVANTHAASGRFSGTIQRQMRCAKPVKVNGAGEVRRPADEQPTRLVSPRLVACGTADAPPFWYPRTVRSRSATAPVQRSRHRTEYRCRGRSHDRHLRFGDTGRYDLGGRS